LDREAALKRGVQAQAEAAEAQREAEKKQREQDAVVKAAQKSGYRGYDYDDAVKFMQNAHGDDWMTLV
jgi:uncharacterized membrane protein YqiK